MTIIFFPLFLFLVSLCMFFVTLKQPHYVHDNNTITYNVRVINGFTNNSSLPLVIWCATPETDMGGRALQEGDDYSWRLTPNYWGRGTNRVYCTLKWDQKRKKFDAFYASRDVRRCSPSKMCLWLVKEDGFYFSSDGLVFIKDFSWT
ncbi:hypothetical protein RND81_12G050200 [Saponaria officinalis]|uniref:S-protein homolog n=1 Tax=Saponaria officinalis TaxID=3572 RepID=A0AAW1H3C2_SAPOF